MSRKPKGISSHQRFCLTSTHVALPSFHFGMKHEHKENTEPQQVVPLIWITPAGQQLHAIL